MVTLWTSGWLRAFSRALPVRSRYSIDVTSRLLSLSLCLPNSSRHSLAKFSLDPYAVSIDNPQEYSTNGLERATRMHCL